ncbi:DUF6701 domain-containing protein [Pseudidiomarina donghaiensis]|uniref:DUF6701 domain-containing protein n=1 Tax=Pseudidiomarina donghaiensis TaxID=519452 RepID=A0A432XK69_9GAMM|nr:DUF6701 domain-containing protein [Pseudidiomarina donghaiensis]RUO49123.1 hypothetical protein CWE24_01010 [Pseudidiomarina donghaiensis]SFV20659.1 protein CcmA, bactofilin family [Pseudidiomarina donghaiensis]
MGFYKHLSWLVLVLLLSCPVSAATYNLKQQVPTGCNQKGNNPVICPNGLTLQWGDIIDATQVLEINVSGDVNLQNAQINVGNANSVIINATGNITTGWQFRIHGSLNAGGTITVDGQSEFIGDLEATTINALNASNNLYQGNLIASNSISLGYQSSVSGSLQGGTIDTNSNTTISGSISGSDITFGSQNTVTGPITGTNSVTLLSQGSIFSSAINSNGPVTIYSQTTINGNVSGSDVVPFFDGSQYQGSNVVINGNVTATNNFVLPSSSQLTGNVTAGSVLIRATSSDIEGDVIASGNVIIESGSGVTGNAAGQNIELQDSAAYITDNAVAEDTITIGWSGSIGGDASATTIDNNSGNPDSVAGNEYCTDSDSTVDPTHAFACSPPGSAGDPGGGGGGSGPPDQCQLFNELAGYGIVGSNGFESGGGSQINNNDIVDETGNGGNTPTPSGSIDTVDLEFPPLDPDVFPIFNGSGTLQNNTNIAPGTYGTIRTQGNNALSSTSGGGTYYIEQITFSTNSNTLTLGPGDYFIKSITLGNNTSINISTSGPVRLFIRDGVSGGNDNSFNSGGNVGDLVVYLYEGADFVIGNYCNSGNNCPEFTFNGLIYSPYETSDIEFGNNTNFQGGALTAGTVTVGQNTEITYSPQTQADVNAAAGCEPEPAAVNHYRILHPTRMVSCLAAPIEIIACANADCSETFDDTVALSATASVSGSTWLGGAITASTAETSEWQFTNGSGSGQLRNTTGGVTAISLTNEVPPATNAVQCYDSTGVSATGCNVEFVNAGLVFTAPDGVSAITSSHAGLDFPILLRAVETNTLTGACEARVQGEQSVNVGLECTNPLTCQAGQSFLANGSSIPLNDNGTTITSAPVSLTFDANGSAPITANYSDVGQLRLHASLNLAENTGNGNPAATLVGTSVNDFVVRPHTLVARALDDAGDLWTTTTNTGAGFKAAGEDFTFIIQSLNANGNPTPNFGNEIGGSENVTASYDSMAYPVIPGDTWSSSKLTITAPFVDDPDYAGALRTGGARWREAGTPNILPALVGNNYLGAGNVLQQVASPIGRFYPDRFELASSSVTNACSVSGFTYMGQPNIAVQFSVRAVNTLGVVTQNYQSDVYDNTAVLALAAANTSPLDTSADAFATRLVAPLTGAWIRGEYDNLGSIATFNRLATEATDGPYTSARLGLRVTTEMDNRDFLVSSLTTQQGMAAQLSGVLELRYGRMVLENTYGPENEPLPVVMRAEYWDGSRFLLNDLDSCTATTATSLNIVENPNALTTTAAGVDSDLLTGELLPESLYWTPPSPTATGEFLFEYQTDSWLEYPWLDENGASHRFPRATAGFGQYRGNDRVIFWIERQ